MLARCRDWASKELADSTRLAGRSEPYVGINETRASSTCLLIVMAIAIAVMQLVGIRTDSHSLAARGLDRGSGREAGQMETRDHGVQSDKRARSVLYMEIGLVDFLLSVDLSLCCSYQCHVKESRILHIV